MAGEKNEAVNMFQNHPSNPTKPIKHWSIFQFSSAFGLIAALAVFVALKPNTASADEPPVYKLVTPKVIVACGATTDAVLRVETIEGWKWNKEYPAKVELSSDNLLSLDPGKFSKGAGNISVDKQNVTMKFKAMAAPEICAAKKGPQSSKVNILASFSICNAETCLVFRKKNFAFDVQIPSSTGGR